jgi:hypothetical protein
LGKIVKHIDEFLHEFLYHYSFIHINCGQLCEFLDEFAITSTT